MTTLQQLMLILLYVWIGLTSMLVVAWALRFRSSRADKHRMGSGTGEAEQSETDDGRSVGRRQDPIPHPSLLTNADSGIDNSETDDAEFWGAERDGPEGETAEPLLTRAVEAGETEKPTPGIATNFFTTRNLSAVDIATANKSSVNVAAAQRASAAPDTFDDGDATLHPGDVELGSAVHPDATATAELSAPPPYTLSEMLDGVNLPYDLIPITSAVQDPNRHLIFLTTHSNAEEVGTRFVDELAELGYQFTPVGLDGGIATRGDDTISMAIVPEARSVTDNNGLRYGSAGQGDVALELWIGDAPSPPGPPLR